MGIYPVPTGRVSDTLMNQRLVSQLEADQTGLLQVQDQVTTGLRMTRPSDDTSSASRAITLQRLIELKTQFGKNLATNQSYLDASDTALSGVSGILADIRGSAIRAADSTTSELEREAIALEISAAIDELTLTGNKTFRGRYLFAGSESTVRPFESSGKYVTYEGNDISLRSLSDIGLMTDTNVPGQDLFGAVSTDLRGDDLNPAITAETRLADLRGGLGITPGNLVISDGTNRSTIDISNAETLGDVVKLIESNPPEGRDLQVTLDANGLRIEIDAAGGGSLIVRDETGGTTARDLGIARSTGLASVPIQGDDLDPILGLTTLLSNVDTWDQSSGIHIVNGPDTFVIDLTAAVTVEDLLNTLNGSDANVLAEINEAGNGINLRSKLSGADFSVGENGGTTATDLGLRSMTLDTALADLNHQLGVRTADGADLVIQRNDGVPLEIDLSNALTVGDVVDLINNHPDNLDPATRVAAQLRPVGNGIELVDGNVTGTETLSVSRGPLSFAAWDLGLVADGDQQTTVADMQPATPATASLSFTPPTNINNQMTLVAAENGTAWNGVRVEFVNNAAVGDVALVSYDPVAKVLEVDVDPTATVANTVISAITLEGTFAAALDLTTDPTNDGSGLVVQTGTIATTIDGTDTVLSGQDVNPLEVEGVFNSLIRLQAAVEGNDVFEIERAVGLLNADFDRINSGRAALGARSQGIDSLRTQHDIEQIELQKSLSEEIDVDLVAAISEMNLRQANYEASLRTMATLYRLSLLDFM